jgi:hypothetical protein
MKKNKVLLCVLIMILVIIVLKVIWMPRKVIREYSVIPEQQKEIK